MIQKSIKYCQCCLGICWVLIFLSGWVFAQNNNPVEKLRTVFQDFQFEKVIFLADSLIISSPDLAKKDILEIYRLKAVSHYSIGQQNHCKLTFKSMLKIDSGYVMEPSINAPKIVQLFNTIKSDYKLPEISQPDKSLQQPDKALTEQLRKKFVMATGRSVIFPGWGHYYLDSEPGIWYMAGSAVLLPLSVYYTAASRYYEKKYLNEIDPQKIESRFRKFDDTYQLRNILLTTYLLYWLYIQYDFFTGEPAMVDEPSVSFNFIQSDRYFMQLNMNLYIPF